MEYGVPEHVRVDFEITTQRITERVHAAGRQRDHEVDVVGRAWLALKGARQASAEEILRTNGGEGVGDLERDVDRVFTRLQPTSGSTLGNSLEASPSRPRDARNVASSYAPGFRLFRLARPPTIVDGYRIAQA